jgi:hypothetical protein
VDGVVSIFLSGCAFEPLASVGDDVNKKLHKQSVNQHLPLKVTLIYMLNWGKRANILISAL